jgi:hypothetical protein
MGLFGGGSAAGGTGGSRGGGGAEGSAFRTMDGHGDSPSASIQAAYLNELNLVPGLQRSNAQSISHPEALAMLNNGVHIDQGPARPTNGSKHLKMGHELPRVIWEVSCKDWVMLAKALPERRATKHPQMNMTESRKNKSNAKTKTKQLV